MVNLPAAKGDFMEKTMTLSPSLIDTRNKRMALAYFSVMLVFHLACLLAFYTGVTWTAFGVFFASYAMKALGITTGFHRYFAHRSYRTNRFFQFILGFMGTTAIQGGVLWWASHHRGHHKHSDKKEDIHSPVAHGFFHSHLGWMWSKECFQETKYKCNDFAKFPEIKFLNKFYGPLIFGQALSFYALGESLNWFFPQLGTSGLQVLVWGFFIATVWTWHVTFSINSICHVYGSKRYDSGDESRNNWLMAILAFGEGWHNNHHKYGWSARNGFKWWEYDVTYYLLKCLELFGIVRDLKVPTKKQIEGV